MDRELAALLVQLSIALHKSAAYPPGHPMVAGAVDVAMGSLTDLLARRGVLALGVARTQLIIDGEGTDPAHLVLRELAQRLYRRQIGGLTFVPGVEPEELAGLLGAINDEGALDAGADPETWPHIQIHPLAFDQLRLADDPDAGDGRDEAKLSRLWVDLADSALGIRTSEGDESPVDPRALASAIDAHAREPEYARAVTRQVLALGRQARARDGADARILKRQLGELLANLKPETLRRLLALGPDPAQREQLMADVTGAMPVKAVIDLLRASAATSDQTISDALLRILAKLAAHAEPDSGPNLPEAEESLREMVRELAKDWALKDPNPESYTEILENFARPTGARPAAPPRPPPKTTDGVELRLVQMSLELGTGGSAVAAAVDTLVRQREIPVLLDLLAHVSPDDPVGEIIWERLPTRDELRRALAEEPPDVPLVDRLVRRLGLDAADSLLDALGGCESLAARRQLLAWLVRLGPGLGPLVMLRLESPQWYMLRNMLVLMGAVDPWPAEFSPARYLTHEDARVRREALKLALRVPDLRDEAVCTGLTDGDDVILRTALAAAGDGCPAEAAPLLIDQLESRPQRADVRLQIVRILGTIRTPTARDCLIRRALRRRRWWSGRQLAPKSPESVAAITGLAANWRHDPAAAAVIGLAARSPDGEVRSAAGVRDG